MKNRVGKIKEENQVIIKVTETNYSCSKTYKGSALGRTLKSVFLQQLGNREYTRVVIWQCMETKNLYMMPRRKKELPLESVILRNTLTPCYKWRDKHSDEKLQFMKQSGVKTEPIILGFEKLSN